MNNDDCDARERLKSLVAASDWAGCYEMLKSPKIQMLLDQDKLEDISEEYLTGITSNVKANFECDFRAVWSSVETLQDGVELANRALAMRGALVCLRALGELTRHLAQTAVAILDCSDLEPTEATIRAFKAMWSEALHAEDTPSERLYLEKALSIAKVVHGPDHPKLFDLMLFSGFAEEKSGNSECAIKFYDEALKLTSRKSDEIREKDRFDALHFLGAQLSNTDRIDEAERYLREAVRIWESSLVGSSRPGPYLKALNTLACLLSGVRRRPHEARRLFEKILHCQDQAVLDADIEFPYFLYNYGQCLLDLEIYEDARRYLEWSRAILEKTTDCDIDLLASVLNGMALSYLEAGEYDSAVQYFEFSVDYSTRPGSKINPTSARNLAVCLDRAGRPEEARPIYERLLSDLKGLNDFARDRALILFDLAKNLGRTGERDDCIAIFNQAIEATISVDGEASEQLAEIYESLATYHGYEVFDYSSAAEFMRKAAHLYEKLYGLSDEKTIDARSELSVFLSGIGHVSEARIYQGETNEVGESEKPNDDDLSMSPIDSFPGGFLNKKSRRVLN
jgi:tetratricopeptide (TPR) repeat protein